MKYPVRIDLLDRKACSPVHDVKVSEWFTNRSLVVAQGHKYGHPMRFEFTTRS